MHPTSIYRYEMKKLLYSIIVTGGCTGVLIILGALLIDTPMIIAAILSCVLFIILVCVYLIALVVAG
jgi:hypothetical protein